MTLEITLPPELEASLVSEAARRKKSPSEVLLDRLRPGAKRGRPVAPRTDAVKRLRDALRLKQPEMAALLGVSKANLHHLENTSVLPTDPAKLKTFKRLAKRHGISLEDDANS